MRVHLGADHAGLELKAELIAWLEQLGHDPIDHGPYLKDPHDDYPVFCLRAAEGVADDYLAGVPSLGVVIGGSGNGEAIAANKVDHIRAALVWSKETARLAREHNDANVMSVGGRLQRFSEITGFLTVFMNTAFTGEERHQRRIDMLADYEQTGIPPELPESALPHVPAELAEDAAAVRSAAKNNRADISQAV